MPVVSIHNIFMPSSATYKLDLKTADPTGCTLSSVVASPRTCSLLDLSEACKNLLLEPAEAQLPATLFQCAQFIFSDFFMLMHRTGLYNRQRTLFDALGRVTTIEYHRASQGFFQKQELPFFEMHLLDGKGHVAVLAQIIQAEALLTGLLDGERQQKDHWRSVLLRLDKLKASRGPTGGLILFSEGQFPNFILSEVLKMTGGSDPVGKYESLLPEPYAVPVDIVECLPEGLRLLHPELVAKSGSPASGS
jgi:hypothetical protein